MKELRFVFFGLALTTMALAWTAAASRAWAGDDEYLPPPDSADKIQLEYGSKNVAAPPSDEAAPTSAGTYDKLELKNGGSLMIESPNDASEPDQD